MTTDPRFAFSRPNTRRKKLRGRELVATGALAALASGCTLPSTPTTTTKVAAAAGNHAPSKPAVSPLTRDLVNDVWANSGLSLAPNEAVLRGIPSNFDWAQSAVRRTWDRANYSAITAWGQIFEAGSLGSPERDVRVQIRSLQIFWLIDGVWKRVTPPTGADGKVEGGYFTPSFSGAVPIATRTDAAGISSFSLTPIHDLSHPVAHFWWGGWYPRPIVPAGATAMHISVMMRLVAADGTTPDLSKAKYIAAVSIDQDKDATDVPGGVKTSLGTPRHKMLSPSWQRFGFTNLTAAQIIANPPPVKAS
jgi:hypothetical protein